MNKFTWIVSFFIFHAAIVSTTHAANVFIAKDSWGKERVVIRGKIERGDFKKVVTQSKKLIRSMSQYTQKRIHYHLNTPGGDAAEAIKIGYFFREILASVDSYGKIIVSPKFAENPKFKATWFDPNQPWKATDYTILDVSERLRLKHIVRNHSAGILMFYGAVKRAHRDNSDQRPGFYSSKRKEIPVMGIHRPYFNKKYFASLSPTQANKAYQNLEKKVRKYMQEMGAPQVLIDRMFETPSNRIELISDSEFRKLYKSEESFIAEWIIARCGGKSLADIFENDEILDWKRISFGQHKARQKLANKLGRGLNYEEIVTTYPSNNYSMDYMKKLYNKMRSYNRKHRSCKDKAIVTHQREWAEK